MSLVTSCNQGVFGVWTAKHWLIQVALLIYLFIFILYGTWRD